VSSTARADANPEQSPVVSPEVSHDEGTSSDRGDAEPPRYLATLSGGAPLRLTRNEDFDQGSFAPAFVDALFGYVPAAGGRLRHGFGLGASLNLSEDGGFTEPVDAGSQLVLMPAYLLHADFEADLFALGHAGIPILLTGDQTAGVELVAAVGYRLFAGAGAFAELGLGTFVGAGSMHASASLELGIFVDYEVLP
jgi:hypothetical protein